MKIVRTILSITLCAVMLATTGFAFYNNHTQNYSGRYSSLTTITEAERNRVLERFGREYDSVEEYVKTVQNYVRGHFHYDKDKKFLLQYYDFEDIVRGDDIVGICFDFATWFKRATLILMESGFLPEDLKVYVCDIRYKTWPAKADHSYNFICLPDGRNIYTDLTMTSSRFDKGLEPGNDFEIFTCSFKDYCGKYEEKIQTLR